LTNPLGRYEEAVAKGDKVVDATVIEAEAVQFVIAANGSLNLGESYL
jgi:hypothetical protein